VPGNFLNDKSRLFLQVFKGNSFLYPECFLFLKKLFRPTFEARHNSSVNNGGKYGQFFKGISAN